MTTTLPECLDEPCDEAYLDGVGARARAAQRRAQSDLARRLVACPRWRWVEGMRIASPPELAGLRVAPGSIVSPHALPDLNDAATVGCVEALVQQALGHDGVSVVVVVRWTSTSLYRVTRWTDSSAEQKTEGWGWTPLTIGGNDHPTKIGALVAALESAP